MLFKPINTQFMMQNYILGCFILFMAALGSVHAQEGLPNNKGTEFWLMLNRNHDNSSFM